MTIAIVSLFLNCLGIRLGATNDNNPVEARADSIELGCPWCLNPKLKILWGFAGIAGQVWIIITFIILSITEHWWWFLLYVPLFLIVNIVRPLLRSILAPIAKNSSESPWAVLELCRIVGCCLIIAGTVLFLMYVLLIIVC